MKLTVLTENTSSHGLPTEHGLSLYIEVNGRKILYDTGQSALFSENAERLGVDLSAVELCVLSHGHYDHGGGLRRFLELNDHAPVYMTRRAFGDYHNASGKYIGLDRELMSSDRLVFTDGVTDIGDGLTLYDCNEREKRYDMGSGGLTVMQNGSLIPDDFRHEQYLLIEEDGRRILVSGCSHKGVLNLTGWFRPDVLIGGFHFMNLPIGDTLRGYAKLLDGCSADCYTCHCTGEEQYTEMKRFMRRLHRIGTGDVIRI